MRPIQQPAFNRETENNKKVCFKLGNGDVRYFDLSYEERQEKSDAYSSIKDCSAHRRHSFKEDIHRKQIKRKGTAVPPPRGRTQYKAFIEDSAKYEHVSVEQYRQRAKTTASNTLKNQSQSVGNVYSSLNSVLHNQYDRIYSSQSTTSGAAILAACIKPVPRCADVATEPAPLTVEKVQKSNTEETSQEPLFSELDMKASIKVVPSPLVRSAITYHSLFPRDIWKPQTKKQGP